MPYNNARYYYALPLSLPVPVPNQACFHEDASDMQNKEGSMEPPDMQNKERERERS